MGVALPAIVQSDASGAMWVSSVRQHFGLRNTGKTLPMDRVALGVSSAISMAPAGSG